MFEYELLEKQLNEDVKKILLLIKQDYYDTFSDKKKELIDNLIECDKVVIVNQGICHFNDNTLAHGGRALRDEKIHFYPDARKFKSSQEAFDKCKKLLIHECFHYFLQPDALEFTDEYEKEMAHFYTEGLVEKEARIFHEKHKDTIAFEKANYGFNINFVNMIQDKLRASSYQDIFSETDYLRDIGAFRNTYENVLNTRKNLLDGIPEMIKDLPTNLQKRVSNKIRLTILQEGNADSAVEKLDSFRLSLTNEIEHNEQEL